MNTQNQHKEARDRFVAFAFVASDFLLEITKAGDIVFSSGKTLSLTGQDSAALIGQNWLSVFSKKNHNDLKALIKGAQRAGRVGPLMVNVHNVKNDLQQRAIVMGMTIPESPNVFLTLNTAPAFFDFLEVSDFNETRLLDEKQFEESAVRAFASAKKEGKNLDVTFLEAEKIEDYKKSLSVDEANSFNENLNAVLKEQSFEGNNASQMAGSKYAIIHDTDIRPEMIEKKIQNLVKRMSPKADDVSMKTKTVEADMDSLNEREARRALLYTMNQIEKQGIDSAGEDLSGSFDDYLHENATKITNLKKIVGHQAFRLQYQPIVYLPNEELCHYEALVRFEDDLEISPYELLTFGEDIGLAPDIDISILKQAIGFVQSNERKGVKVKVAVNVSGVSIQSEDFFKAVIETLDETKCNPELIIFEVTESTEISNLEEVNEYLQALRKRKHEVCLDDFGAGAASFQYLNALDIDCVKIDGKYIRDALNSSRDEAMVRNLVRMCKDLGVSTVAEMVETEEQCQYLTKIGVDKAQGWLFGKPDKKVGYIKRV
jgi:EAL domain-containing protein (putative c-di-GMP-specific phosphodiesterase class I)